MLAFQMPGLAEWVCLLTIGGIIVLVILVATGRRVGPRPPAPPGFPVQPAGGRRCGKCQAINDPRAAFCPRCGQRLG